MSCPVCWDKGLVMVRYDGEPEYVGEIAVCLCERGQRLRVEGAGRQPAFIAWAAREGIEPERMALIEELYSPAELREMGLCPLATVTDITQIGRREAKL